MIKPAPLSTFANMPAAEVQGDDEFDVKPEVSVNGKPVKMKQKVFRLTLAQDRRLREVCVQTDLSMQTIVLRGINMVLYKKGLPKL